MYILFFSWKGGVNKINIFNFQKLNSVSFVY
jgi:hypothetical protein